jgi:hypothetical protein
MKKEAKIAFGLLLVVAWFATKALLQWLSIELRFEKNKMDMLFEQKLYESLVPYKPIKVSDIHHGNWNKVCILYVYGRPDREVKQYAGQLEENFYLSRKWEIPIFSEKFGEGVWWVFFVDKREIVTELYRMGISAAPTFRENIVYEKEIPEYINHLDLNEFNILGPSDSCASVESAYVMQTHEGYLYNKSKAFILMGKK